MGKLFQILPMNYTKKLIYSVKLWKKLKKEYVDDVDQAEVMDSAINGVLQSLDPYSAYMSPELFKSMQTESKRRIWGTGNRNRYGSWSCKSNFSYS